MGAMHAQRHLDLFEEGTRLVEQFGQEKLKSYFASEYFGENADRDMLNGPNDRFWEVQKQEAPAGTKRSVAPKAP